MSQLLEIQQQSPAFHFSAPHFSAKNLRLKEILAEKWDQSLVACRNRGRAFKLQICRPTPIWRLGFISQLNNFM
jgi:hypothetical protein